MILTGTNSYTGGTAIDGGVLQVSSDANLGAASGALSFGDATLGGMLNTTAGFTSARNVTLNAGGGTIDQSAGGAVTLSGVIGGTGALTKTGAGDLILTGANAYTGGTAINGGVLRISSDANLGAAAGGLTLDGGTLNTTTGLITLNRAITLEAGGGTIQADIGTTLNGVITGTGGLTKTGSSTLTLTGASTYTGGTTISSGGLTLSGAGVSIVGDVVDNALLNLTRGTFTGTISGSGNLNKLAGGIQVLTGANTYTGSTTVVSGTLLINGDQSGATGLTTVNANASLGGGGVIGGDVSFSGSGGSTLARRPVRRTR